MNVPENVRFDGRGIAMITGGSQLSTFWACRLCGGGVRATESLLYDVLSKCLPYARSNTFLTNSQNPSIVLQLLTIRRYDRGRTAAPPPFHPA